MGSDHHEAAHIPVAVLPAQLVFDRPFVAPWRGEDFQRKSHHCARNTARTVHRPQKSFTLERHLGNAWYFIPDPGPDEDIVVRFQPLVARNVAEVIWHKTQRLEVQDDGWLLFHARVSGINEIVWWILGYGDQAQVLIPLKLRRLVAHRARAMVENYGSSG
jgi:predicted DNA-binding transcriptional regulator YafY